MQIGSAPTSKLKCVPESRLPPCRLEPPPFLFLLLLTNCFVCAACLRKRGDSVQYPRHIIWRHLAILQAANLAALTQPLQAEGKLPALRVIDEEDILLAIGITYRSTEDVQTFRRLSTTL